MSARLSLRAGDERDVAAVIALMDEAVAWLLARGQTGQWGTEPLSARAGGHEHMLQIIAGGELRMAEIGGEPAGAMVVGPPPHYAPPIDRPELYVNLLVTSRRRAGCGIGARLLRDAIGIARRAGAEVLRVDCWAGSERLVSYYEEQGFARTERFEVRGWPGQVLAMELAAS